MTVSSAQNENNLKRPDDVNSNFKNFKVSLKLVKKPTTIIERDSTASMVTGDPTGTLMYGNRQALPANNTIILNDNNTLSRVWTYDDDLN